MEKIQLWIEFILLYIGLPVAVALWFPNWSAIPVLWGGGLAAWGLLKAKSTTKQEPLLFKDVDPVSLWKAVVIVLARFALCAALLTGLLYWRHPDWLLAFPKTMTDRWAIVIVLYPILSVFPQVIVYRVLFVKRYSSLFGYKPVAWMVGAFVFSLAHLTFWNSFSMAATFAGGLLFIRTYQKTRSVWLNVLEHSLYGDFLFTIGWGVYFFHGGTRALLGQ